MSDLAIVGSGFGGSILAMTARALGLRVMLIERGCHPRFAIGESASPLAGVLLETLADRYDLPSLRPLAAYGAWRRTYPGVVCGLKRGFTYFKHEEGQRYVTRSDRSNGLMVAASPNDEVSDTHWLRADVDHFLVQEAVSLGADYADQVALESLEWTPSGRAVLRGSRAGQRFRAEADLVIDATGPRGFLHGALGLEAAGFDAYPGTQALYSHFTGVSRCAAMPEYANTDVPPYPMDAAALHHVFDEGWMWVLRFDNGVTSAGIAVTDALAASLRLADGEAAWKRFLARYPSIAAQFAEARPIRPFTWMPRLAWRATRAAGERWAMLPSAAAFVDPLFSSGIPMTLVGIERLARALEQWIGANRDSLPGWEEYERITLAEADHTARFVAGCYAAFPRFEAFVAYSMFYFAAASFSEVLRRLGGQPRGFLLAADPGFERAVAGLSPARGFVTSLAERVAECVDRFNVAGLCNPARRNWYGVDLEDTVRACAKLGVTPDEVRRTLTPLMALGAGASLNASLST